MGERFPVGSRRVGGTGRACACASAGACVGALLMLLAACAGGQTVEQRFRAMPSQDDVIAAGDWYRPLERVAGGGLGPEWRVAPVPRDIDARVARAYLDMRG